jgi:hypothetical protein
MEGNVVMRITQRLPNETMSFVGERRRRAAVGDEEEGEWEEESLWFM